MRAIVLSLVLTACTTTAEAGDLWLTIDQEKPDESIHLRLPGNWLADAKEPVELQSAGKTVDLAAEARRLRAKGVGSQQSWTTTDGDGPSTIALSHERHTAGKASSLEMATVGPKGNGLTVSMALEPEQLGQSANHLDGVLDLDGVQVDLSEALCAQLKESGPVVLVKTTGPKGGGVTIATK